MKRRDLISGVTGAATAVLVLVGVYEGKVIASQGKSAVTLTAGEAARSNGSSVERAGDVAAAEKYFDGERDKRAEAGLEQANANLAETVRDYRRKLETIEAQKKELGDRLGAAEEKLKASGEKPVAAKNEYDLSREDWAELAKTGGLKYSIPCKAPWSSADASERLQKLALAPSDRVPVEEAARKANDWTWARVRPYCLEILGKESVVDKLGVHQCAGVALNVLQATDREALIEARYQVGEIQAGLRPPPGLGDKPGPALALLLALTDGSRQFEQELAQSFPPEEAHRIAYAPEMCRGSSNWGSIGPRKK